MENQEEVKKLFVGGISGLTWAILEKYFSKYGEVSFCQVYKDRFTGAGRGFAFVGFVDSSAVDRVLQENHIIDNIQVDVKRAKPREDLSLQARKLFVGGLPHDITDQDFTEYFSQFGEIVDSNVIHHKLYKQSRGFGFVTFESEESSRKVLNCQTGHKLKDSFVDVKPAVSKHIIAYANYYYQCDYYMGYNYWAPSLYMVPPYYYPYPDYYPVGSTGRYNSRFNSNKPISTSSSRLPVKINSPTKIPAEVPKESEEIKNEEPEENKEIQIVSSSSSGSEVDKDYLAKSATEDQLG